MPMACSASRSLQKSAGMTSSHPVDLFQGDEDLLPRLGVEVMAIETDEERPAKGGGPPTSRKPSPHGSATYPPAPPVRRPPLLHAEADRTPCLLRWRHELPNGVE